MTYMESTVPDNAQAVSTDQFIGTNKGAIPDRSVFQTEAEITDIPN
jgi:hypothetical protein